MVSTYSNSAGAKYRSGLWYQREATVLERKTGADYGINMQQQCWSEVLERTTGMESLYRSVLSVILDEFRYDPISIFWLISLRYPICISDRGITRHNSFR